MRRSLADLEPGHRVLVALSGGPDSLALVAATETVAAERGLLCGAVIVDHGLQAGSAVVADGAAAQAKLLGCDDVRVVRVQVAAGPGNGGPEAAARTARYAALEAAAAGGGAEPAAEAVLLGHTREDQAESVLLGLARGSGLRSLAGMARHSAIYRRPLLDVPRSVVRAAAEALAQEDPRLAAWSDPHNEDDRFARARVRSAVLPQLEAALGPGVVAGLARTAALARDDADALDVWAGRVWDELRGSGAIRLADPGDTSDGRPPHRHVAALSVPVLTGPADRGTGRDGPPAMPRAIRSRVVRRLLVEAGCPAGALTSQHVRDVLALVDGSAGIRAETALPGGRRARREGADLRVRV